MTYLAFDLVVAALLLLAAWRGYRRGFILTLCGFLAIFVALIGASLVSNTLAAPLSRTLQPVVEHSLQQIFQEHISGGSSAQLPGGAQLPDTSAPVISEGQEEPEESPQAADLPLEEALAVLKDSKLYQGFADAFQKAVNEGLVAATANAARVISDYIARQVAQLLVFVVSFVLILVLWFFLSHALDLAFKLPVLSTLNRWSGAALGLFKGSLLLFIACWLLKGSLLPQEAIQNTYLLKFFCTASPLTLLS